jgi:hypothetical protein
MTQMTQKKSFFMRVLAQLGQEIPDDDTLNRAIVNASREFKEDLGLSPNPDVALQLVTLPGVESGSNKFQQLIDAGG